ncbi:venom metalloproteinase antarease TserMP_A-like [Dermacentor variabilis]|uniref:venom metalloproteinase antarease TserMP_A-like n=1 Tax=Dermacentor variabilis TaxID=34621 RepID=UPI003F5C5A53
MTLAARLAAIFCLAASVKHSEISQSSQVEAQDSNGVHLRDLFIVHRPWSSSGGCIFDKKRPHCERKTTFIACGGNEAIQRLLRLTCCVARICAGCEQYLGRHIDAGSVLLNGSELEEHLYHDSEHRSSLLVMPRKNGVEVRGILNAQLRIRPAVFAQRSDEGLIPHEVVMIEESPQMPSETEAPQKGAVTDRFVVEVCFVVGAEYEKAFNETRDLLIYLGTLLNAGETSAGRNICGKALYELREPHVCAVDTREMLNKTAELIKSCQFTHCDLAVRLTSEDLAEKLNDTFINRKVHGLAFIAGVCTDYNVAVAEDDPHKFNGVFTVAHEIAHTLGASHDGVLEPSHTEGYPQGLNCSWQDGYLMSFSATGKNMYSLSNCTENQIRFVVRSLEPMFMTHGSDVPENIEIPHGTNSLNCHLVAFVHF